MPELKRHYFLPCNTHYSLPEDVRTTNFLKETTCGACKQRVLKVLQDADWSTLPEHVYDAILWAACRANPT